MRLKARFQCSDWWSLDCDGCGLTVWLKRMPHVNGGTRERHSERSGGPLFLRPAFAGRPPRSEESLYAFRHAARSRLSVLADPGAAFWRRRDFSIVGLGRAAIFEDHEQPGHGRAILIAQELLLQTRDAEPSLRRNFAHMIGVMRIAAGVVEPVRVNVALL
jgi:hypothetical protein